MDLIKIPGAFIQQYDKRFAGQYQGREAYAIGNIQLDAPSWPTSSRTILQLIPQGRGDVGPYIAGVAHDPGYFLGKIGQPGFHAVGARLGAGVDADLLAVLDADNLIILVKQASGCLGQADLEGNAVFEDEGITDLPVLFPALGIEAELAGRGEVIASDEGMSHTKEFQYHAPVIRLGDRMGTTKMDVLTAFQDCVEPMEHLRPSLPVPGGSQCAGSFKTLYEMFGSSDFGIVPGRTIFNHLIGPEGGATAVLQGWEAVENNIFREIRLGT